MTHSAIEIAVLCHPEDRQDALNVKNILSTSAAVWNFDSIETDEQDRLSNVEQALSSARVVVPILSPEFNNWQDVVGIKGLSALSLLQQIADQGKNLSALHLRSSEASIKIDAMQETSVENGLSYCPHLLYLQTLYSFTQQVLKLASTVSPSKPIQLTLDTPNASLCSDDFNKASVNHGIYTAPADVIRLEKIITQSTSSSKRRKKVPVALG
ncbi:MAG: hypothetical protein ACOYK8_06350 [Alphaproteobacteria bacterium]